MLRDIDNFYLRKTSL